MAGVGEGEGRFAAGDRAAGIAPTGLMGGRANALLATCMGRMGASGGGLEISLPRLVSVVAPFNRGAVPFPFPHRIPTTEPSLAGSALVCTVSCTAPLPLVVAGRP
eukprot:CAMPEP_0175865036 /NCGR_PEP_ID=MMETSP0107_2-20121207/33425_1 /TAXON_ID=195067 ORGANISM="Goniomonas pacifica, Strain CCMP1869" /NCGR_SAMPLE_ID=MMETSP0107_2 /ASSEMBLY_ACC=CAM_ASM_000203 /LENGTH=105 /DNA_ID=CAMNT_0017182397 /DNA_START=93 /DNA_END=410 /DNA_ORIENTATION=+